MDAQKISLNSELTRSRFKKYDTYVHNARRSKRVVDATVVAQPAVAKKEILSSRLDRSDVQQQLSNARQRQRVNKEQFSRKIALHSVAHAQESDDSSHIQRQFRDENKIEYTSAEKRPSRLKKALYAFSMVVLVLAAGVSVQSFLSNRNISDHVAALAATTDDQGVSEGTGSEPSEEPVSNNAIAAYRVPAQQPRYIRIPDIGVMARVKNLGLDNTGAVDAPGNINDAAWYNGSALPGSDVGSSLILGHVSGWTAPGVFKKADSLKPGAIVEIEKGNGDKIKYMVREVVSMPVDQIDMAQVLTPDDPNKHDLKLMTCSGKYNRDTDEYSERLIVHAVAL